MTEKDIRNIAKLIFHTGIFGMGIQTIPTSEEADISPPYRVGGTSKVFPAGKLQKIWKLVVVKVVCSLKQLFT